VCAAAIEWGETSGPGIDPARSVPISGTIKTNSGDLLRTLAVDGYGIVRLPSFLVGEDLLAGRLVPLLREFAEPEIAIYAVYPHRRLVPAKVRVFVDLLVEIFGPRPLWERWLRQQESISDKGA
jgi:DNA-binding transcriptional LysR family regulator